MSLNLSLWAPLFLLIIMGDWTGRVYSGRAGHVRVGRAVTAGLFAMLAATLLSPGDHAWTVAFIAAGSSIVLETVAGLWPLAPGEPVPRTARRDDYIFDQAQAAAAAAGVGGFGPATDFRTPPPLPGSAGSGPRRDSAFVGVEPAVATSAPPVMARGPHGFPVAAAASAVSPLAPLQAAAPPVRSASVRTLWLIGGIIMLGAAAVSFVGFGLATPRRAADAFGLLACGIGAALMSVCTMTRAIHRRHRGVWRGIVRPYLSTLGLAATAIAGASTGYIARYGQDQALAMAACIAGVVFAIIVWLIPMPQYAPPAEIDRPDETQRYRRLGRNWLIAAGTTTVVAILASALLSQVARCSGDVVGAAVIPISLIGFSFYIAGAVYLYKGYSPGQAAQLSLPIRRDFEIARLSNLGELIERHFLLLGYRLSSTANLLWSFKRGDWTSQIWKSSIRAYRTTVNIAAYESAGGYRISCYVDVQPGWNKLAQKELTVFVDEIDGLEQLLRGASA